MSTIRQVVRRRRQRRTYQQTGPQRFLRSILIGLLGVLGIAALLIMAGSATLAILYTYYSAQLPEPGAITTVEEDFETTRLYDRSGEVLLYEVLDPLAGDRSWVDLQDIPLTLRYATISIEDKTYYENPGYSLEGLFRAAWNNFTGGSIQGGSSITQQLVKNVLIAPEERTAITYDRKIKELILAIRVSNLYSKDQILEWYLNTNFYGNLAYGVEAAAQVYFNKSVSDLSLAEAAMLAAIPQSPALNPIDNYELARVRQRVVLDLMVEEGYITAEQADLAFAQDLDIRQPEQRFNLLAPHFAIAARKQLEALVGPDLAYRGGLVVYTTLDYDLYLQTECTARTHVERLSGQPADTVLPAEDGSPCLAATYLPAYPANRTGIDHNVSNSAAVVMNAETGEVLTMLGSLDYYDLAIDGNFNVAQAERQPGSTFKPFTYLTAFEQGYTPATMVLDVRTAFDIGSTQPYVPENINRQFHGPMSIREALANSYNVPAVQVQGWVGIDNTLRTAHAMGINSLNAGLNQYGLSLALGAGEVTLYDLTYAYSVLANNGIMGGMPVPDEADRAGFRTLDPTLILRVETREGDILWEYGQDGTFQQRIVLDPTFAYLMTDILSDDEARLPTLGSNSPLSLDRPAAAKTGTTNDYRDNWTIGYTPQRVVGVWVGNSDNAAMNNLPASVGAAPIWNALMQYASADLPPVGWEAPDDLIEMTVCQVSGQLPNGYCPTYQEIFKAGTEPITYDTIYQPFRINRETGLLATVYTPAELIDERVYMVLPDAAADWARDNGIAVPPDEYDTVSNPSVYGPVAITNPVPFSYVSGQVTLFGNATDPNFSFYRLDYGEGLNPTEWIQIGGNTYSPRLGGTLGTWSTDLLEGLYSLRLQVVLADNSVEEFIYQVTVDNTAPTIELITPEPDEQFSLDDEFITIQPFVTDNISMDRVEFYVDDELIATSTIAPYNERWLITSPGLHTIQLRAYDAVGNTSVSERIFIEILVD